MTREVELTPVTRPCGLYREYIKGEMKRILLSEDILVKILIDWYGQPTFVKQDWRQYWAPVTSQLSSKALRILDNLRSSHQQYIASGFTCETSIRYCYRYFILLEETLSILNNLRNDVATSVLLKKVLGFENFTIGWVDGSTGSACGTSTIRNPCYLLAKIRQPKARDDPKFLAIITDPNISNETNLFYHYRQHKIDDEFGISLLLCPAVALAERANSFILIESLTSGFSDKTDPRSRRRSQVLADLAISPFLSKLSSIADFKPAQEVSFVDIGSGNGALVSNIWRRMLKAQPQILQDCKLACSMVGLRVQDPLRHFNRGSLRGTVSYLDYCPVDYLNWIQEHQSDKGSYEFDVALVCRLFNNLSLFELHPSTDWRIIQKLGDKELCKAAWLSRSFVPQNCLNPDELEVEHICLKSSNVSLRIGKSFRHLSLSDYYKGLQLLHSRSVSSDGTTDMIYCPVRRFSPSCLQLPNGGSVLKELCNLARLVVIEDIDLTEEDLIHHLLEYDLENIAVTHVNRHNRLNSALVFCLCNVELSDLLAGKKIWPNSLKKIESRMYSHLRSSAVFQKYRLST